MKTMKKGNDIVRVRNDEFQKYIDDDYYYIPKSEWKEKVRDINKKEPKE